MKRLTALALAFALSATAALAQSAGGGSPVYTAWYPTGRATLSVSSTSASVALPSSGPTAEICNQGATDAYLLFGLVPATTVTTSTGWLIQAGNCIAYNMKPASTLYTYVAAITAASTTTLYIETGQGSQQAGQGVNTVSISGSLTVNQGDAGAEPWPVTADALPLPTGAATSANQTTGNASLATIAANTTGAATAAAQATGNASLASLVTNSTAITNNAGVSGSKATAVQGIAGGLAIKVTPDSTGATGIAPQNSTSAESCHTIKSGSGTLYNLTTSIGATSGWVLVFDTASAPSDGAVTPLWWWPVSSNGSQGGMSAAWAPGTGLSFSTGLVACFSTTGPFTKTASATAAFSGSAQ